MTNFEHSMRRLLKSKNQENGKRKVLFVEGWSKRMQMAINILETEGLLESLCLFETRAQLDELNIKPNNYLIIEEETELFNELVDKYVEIRKGKETKEQAINNLKKAPFFGAMMVRTGKVCGAVGGIYFPTGDILKAAFKSIGAKEGVKTISSVMIMNRNEQWYIFTDISVNPTPNKEMLVDIAKNACDFGDFIGFKKKLAFLSFSTLGSAVTEQSKMIAEATEEFNKRYDPKYKALGEIQFDAAFSIDVREQKYKKDDGFKKMPTIFVFPDLNSGNIGYKIAQRMGNWGAVGPIITGLKSPFNDLSRGSTVEDIVNTAVITALQGFTKDGK